MIFRVYEVGRLCEGREGCVSGEAGDLVVPGLPLCDPWLRLQRQHMLLPCSLKKQGTIQRTPWTVG